MTDQTPEGIPDVDDADDFEPVNPAHWLADTPTTEPQDDIPSDTRSDESEPGNA